MEESRLSYRRWLTAVYLMGTSLKGVSSTKLGNDLGRVSEDRMVSRS